MLAAGKVVDFAAARDEAAKEDKKAVKQKSPTEKDKPAKPGRGRPPKEGKAAPDKAKPPKMSQSRVWGGSPTSVFVSNRDAKIASVATLALLAVSAFPGNPAKNGDSAVSYAPSAPRLRLQDDADKICLCIYLGTICPKEKLKKPVTKTKIYRVDR